jgi:DNA-binding MarR family transcriptional regulator/N-acetylglutamate synthase-like GNAT family acetyltransferase
MAASRVAAVRRFNRFYTREIGVLDEHSLGGGFALVEVRVLYELAQRAVATATELRNELGIDAGYMSRILARFAKRGLVRRAANDRDARRRPMALTSEGRKTFARLDAQSENHIGKMLAKVAPSQQERAVAAMATIERALRGPSSDGVTLRAPRAGDLGWVVHRHGVLYWEEYRWDARFEALVARIVADFVESADAARERCWIAEHGGEIAGSIFLVKKTKTVAKLRLLYVEPWARGMGIGAKLVDACIAFARAAGYRRIELWTNDVLHAARRIYERAGFQLISAESHRSFGHDLVAQIWSLDLHRP